MLVIRIYCGKKRAIRRRRGLTRFSIFNSPGIDGKGRIRNSTDRFCVMNGVAVLCKRRMLNIQYDSFQRRDKKKGQFGGGKCLRKIILNCKPFV
jgi:hypothetical protein